MPGDRFALAVRIGREVDDLGFRDLAFDPCHALSSARERAVADFLRRDVFVLKRKIRLADAKFALRQVANMAHTRDHLPIVAEITLDTGNLIRTLHHHEFHTLARVG